MNEIERTLENIGLTKGEIDVYLALIKYGLSTTGRITKEANIGSSKVYEVLQRLITKGLACYVIENNIKHYSATPTKNLFHFLEEKKNNIKKTEEGLKKILPQLEKEKINTNQAESLIYRGNQGPKILLKELIEIGKKGHEIIGYGTDTDDWGEKYPAQLQEFINDSKKYKIKSRILFQEGFTPKNNTAKVRHIPESLSSPVRTIIAGNKVYIVDFTEPITTIVIEKKEIAENYRKHFEILWNIAK